METNPDANPGNVVDCDGSDVASNCTEIAQIDDVILEPEVDSGGGDDDALRRKNERTSKGKEDEAKAAGESESHISSSNQVSSSSSSSTSSPSSSSSSCSLSPKEDHYHHRQKEIGSPERNTDHPLSITITTSIQNSSSSSSSSSPPSSSVTLPSTISPRSSDGIFNHLPVCTNNKPSGCLVSAFGDNRFQNNNSSTTTTYFQEHKDYETNNSSKYNVNSTSALNKTHNNNNDELMLEVTCGQNSAFLYMSRLQLGSKGTCVYFDGSWLTPNEFQFVSGRETAKDWKRSIKHHGKSLKVLIAKGILTTSPLRCSCGQCSNNVAVPLVQQQQHLFGPNNANVTSLLLQQQQQPVNASSQVKEKSNGTSDIKKFSPCCSVDGPTSANSQQYVLSTTPTPHHLPIFSPHPPTLHHYSNHHQVYAGGHTSHHFPRNGNGYFKMADDLMMMKASFLSPSVAMESPYGAFYAGGACFPMAQTEHCRSKQINDLSGDEISKCSKDGTPKVEDRPMEAIDCTSPSELKPTNDSTLTTSASSSSSTNDGGEKDKTGNDVRYSVTTRDCGTSFDRKHVSGSGKTSCRKSSSSKDEKTACQASILPTGSPSKLPQQSENIADEQHSNDRTIINDDEDDDDDDANKFKTQDKKDDNNNGKVTDKNVHEDHHDDGDHHQNSHGKSTLQDTQNPYFSSMRVPAFGDVVGYLPESYYSMFSGNYPSPSCYPPVLGTYPPFYPSPYFFPMTQSSFIPQTAGSFPYPWSMVPVESHNSSYIKPTLESQPSSSKNDVVGESSWVASTTTTSSNPTPIFNFPWMNHQESTNSTNNPQIFPSAFEAAKRKFSSIDTSDDKERVVSPPSCKRFHGDANQSPYISGLGSCWPMTHFYYAPHFEFRSLMVNPFSPCEVAPCEAGRSLLGGGAVAGGKLDPYAHLFPSLYSVPYLHGISTR